MSYKKNNNNNNTIIILLLLFLFSFIKKAKKKATIIFHPEEAEFIYPDENGVLNEPILDKPIEPIDDIISQIDPIVMLDEETYEREYDLKRPKQIDEKIKFSSPIVSRPKPVFIKPAVQKEIFERPIISYTPIGIENNNFFLNDFRPEMRIKRKPIRLTSKF